jgi:1-deoxy-D-xylulose-5-phosphate synthase
MLLTAIEYPGPAALRYPRGNGVGVEISQPPQPLEIGKAEVIRKGGDIAILAYGSMVYPAIEAAEGLAAEGISATVVNARFVKPLDTETILSLARDIRALITVEEAYLAGGFGSAVIEVLEANSLLDKTIVHRMGVADEIVTHGDPKLLLAKYGLNSEGIMERAKQALFEARGDSKGTRLKAVK